MVVVGAPQPYKPQNIHVFVNGNGFSRKRFYIRTNGVHVIADNDLITGWLGFWDRRALRLARWVERTVLHRKYHKLSFHSFKAKGPITKSGSRLDRQLLSIHQRFLKMRHSTTTSRRVSPPIAKRALPWNDDRRPIN